MKNIVYSILVFVLSFFQVADVLLRADATLTSCPACVATPPHVRGADYSRPFVDVADAFWMRG